MLELEQIQSIQIEVSNHCNSACPQCPRNYYGGATIPTLPLRRWSLPEFRRVITDDVLKRVKKVYFCGTYGDPLTNSQLVDMVRWVRRYPDIRVGAHTNGGVGRVDHYQDLACELDFLAFGIDGLEDTNHVYRRNVKWSQVMRRATAFIEAGGHAVWDFIVFAHNEHQVESARKLSREMGFRQFNVKRTSRFLRRNHEYSEELDVRNLRGTVDYKIKIPQDTRYVNQDYRKIISIQSLSDYASTTEIRCNAQRIGEIYIGADGFVFPCGWLHDRMYGPEVTLHPDHAKIHKLIAQAGGYKGTNVFYSPLTDILAGEWFRIIEHSWGNADRLERCGMICGKDINLIGDQNSNVRY